MKNDQKKCLIRSKSFYFRFFFHLNSPFLLVWQIFITIFSNMRFDPHISGYGGSVKQRRATQLISGSIPVRPRSVYFA